MNGLLFRLLLLALASGLSACTLAPARLKPAHPPFGKKTPDWEAAATAIERDPASEAALEALAALVAETHQRLFQASPGTTTLLTPQLKLTPAPFAPGRYAINYFDALTPPCTYVVKELERHVRNGTGLPLLGLRENHGRLPLEANYPPEAITRAVTAVA